MRLGKRSPELHSVSQGALYNENPKRDVFGISFRSSFRNISGLYREGDDE